MALQTKNISAHSIENMAETVNDIEQLNRFDIDEVQSRIDYLQSLWARFCEKHAELMSKAEQLESQKWYQRAYNYTEQLYLDVDAKLNGRLRQLRQEQNENNVQNNPFINSNDGIHNESDIPANQEQFNQQLHGSRTQEPVRQVYYPYKGSQRIENTWGYFNGNLLQWQGFHDRFVSEVHNNQTIANSYKFILLRDSLKDKAAAALGEWSSSDENYPEAWARVNQMFNRKYQTVHELMAKFKNLPALEKASSYMLQKLSNTTHEVVRQLKSLDCPVEHCDFVFVHGLQDKLDPDTQRVWELERKTEIPTLKKMLEFVDTQAKALCYMPSTERKEHRDNRNGRKRSSNEKSNDEKRKKSDSNKPDSGSKKTEQNKCKLCNENHRLYRCSKFLKLNLQARKKIVKDNQLCHNCLSPGHFSKDCFLEACRRCNLKHNSAICAENPIIRAINTVQWKGKDKSKNKKEEKSESKEEEKRE